VDTLWNLRHAGGLLFREFRRDGPHGENPRKRLQALYDRAAEMRVLSTMMDHVETQAIMIRLADDYDKLGERAEKRANGQVPLRS
jgi:hypothetical protein